MVNNFQVNESAGKFRLVFDDATGGYVSDVAPDRIADNQCGCLIDALIHRPGPVRSRGPIPLSADGAAGAICTAGTAGSAVRVHPGQLLSTAGSVLPAYGFTPSSGTKAQQNSAPTGILASAPTLSGGAQAIGPSATVDDIMFTSIQGPSISFTSVCATSNAAPTASSNVDATMAFTQSSAAITTSASFFTQAMVGAFVMPAAMTGICCRILSVTDGTHATMDRVWPLANATGGQVSVMNSVWKLYAGNANTPGTPQAFGKAVCAAWGRLVMGANYVYDGTTSTSFYPNRIIWSGIARSSTEGTAPWTGTSAMSTKGYLDLPSELGEIKAIQQFGSAVLVFCRRAIVVLRGAPEFDGLGSLDASTVYRGYSLASADCVCVTPYGVAFFDQYKGLHLVADDGRPPRSLSRDKVDAFLLNYPPTNMGYASDHLFLLGNATRQLIFSFAREAFVQLRTSTLASAAPGRGATEELIALDTATGKIVNVGALLGGGAGSDAVGSGPRMTIQSKSFGSPSQLLRPSSVQVVSSSVNLSAESVAINLGFPLQGTVNVSYSGISSQAFTGLGSEQVQHGAVTDLARGHHVGVEYSAPAAGKSNIVNQIILDGNYVDECDA